MAKRAADGKTFRERGAPLWHRRGPYGNATSFLWVASVPLSILGDDREHYVKMRGHKIKGAALQVSLSESTLEKERRLGRSWIKGETIKPGRRGLVPPARFCACCGACFFSHRPEHQFCSSECRKHNQRAKSLQAKGCNIDARQVRIMVSAGKCQVCGATSELGIDHCHVSGNPRGLLCRGCNTALGHARDTPERLRALAHYLEEVAA